MALHRLSGSFRAQAIQFGVEVPFCDDSKLGGNMNTVKTLLSGSAASFIVIAGAQAADLPVKAKAIEYVKVCSLYGAGFYYIPGTDTCIKLGGYVRVETMHNASGSFNTYINGTNALYDRGTRVHPTRARSVISADVRTQTEYGTLRSYLRGGWQWSTGDAVTSNNNITYYDYGYIQFAGFTFGKTDSFFDFFPIGTFSYQSQYFEGRSDNGGRQTVFAYTAQFGNGVTANLSLEDRSWRSTPVIDLSTIGAAAYNFNISNATSRTGQTVPDVVVNIRVDQTWGSAQIMGALHENSATYYGGDQNLGHPGSKWGWAAGAGLTLNMPWDTKDTFSVQGVYCEGAVKYCTSPTSANGSGLMVGWRRNAGQVGVAWVDDAYYVTGGSLELSKSFSLAAGFQHYWTSSLRSSIYGQYANFEANSSSVDNLVCAGGLGAGAADSQRNVGALGAGCADWSAWQMGSRTVWNPVANLEIGVDVLYTKVNSAFQGATFNVAPNGGTAYAQPVGDGSVWSAIFRVQRNFWP